MWLKNITKFSHPNEFVIEFYKKGKEDLMIKVEVK